jgi:hypothetical protein
MGHLLRIARVPGVRRLGALILLCTLLGGCGNGEKSATVDSYRTDAAGRTLTLDLVARPRSTPRAEVVSQDSSGVVVKVRVKEAGGSNVDLGQHYQVSVRLDSPLGRRTVRTDEGATVPPAS